MAKKTLLISLGAPGKNEDEAVWVDATTESFPGHVGRPGLRGGSLPRDAGAPPRYGPGDKVAVFTVGGISSGKSTTLGAVLDKSLSDGNRHIDADEEKRRIYDMLGDPNSWRTNPGGPRTWDDLRAKYSPEQIATLEGYVRTETPYDSIQQFADQIDHSKIGDEQEFGGGIVHELSSYVSKSRLNNMIDAGPSHGSFVYDAIGNDKYPQYWANARNAGFKVVVVNVDANPATASYLNSLRERSVEPDQAVSTHLKVDSLVPSLYEQARAQGVEWIYTEPTRNELAVATASKQGFTPYGAPGPAYTSTEDANVAGATVKSYPSGDTVAYTKSGGRTTASIIGQRHGFTSPEYDSYRRSQRAKGSSGTYRSPAGNPISIYATNLRRR